MSCDNTEVCLRISLLYELQRLKCSVSRIMGLLCVIDKHVSYHSGKHETFGG